LSNFQKRLALSVPFDFEMGSQAEIAREMEERGYTDAWSYEIDGNDAFTPLALVGQATQMRLGTAIVNVFTRGPATIAQSAATLADLAPGRFVLGIGTGSQPIVESWNGMKFSKPATRVRDMVEFLRPALAGERVNFKGKTFSVDGFRLSRPPSQPVPIHVAALREGMLRTAGEVADGVCINWLSAEDVKKSVAVVREAAAAAGRDPASIEVTCRIMMSIDPPGEEEALFARRLLAGYLTVPVYREFHKWLGRTSLQGLWDAWEAGDRRGGIAALTEETVNEVVVRGTAEERRDHVQRYFDAGVDTAFLMLNTGAADRDERKRRIVQTLREHAPQ
jgi:probable F420-dependent oxidoreductase